MLYKSDGHVLIPVEEKAVKFIQLRLERVVDMSEASHSSKQHRGFFSYLNWWWMDYEREQYQDPDAFRQQLSIWIGHVKIVKIKVGDNWLDCQIAKSWSPRTCGQEEFNGIVERASEIGKQRTGISFAEYLEKIPAFRPA